MPIWNTCIATLICFLIVVGIVLFIVWKQATRFLEPFVTSPSDPLEIQIITIYKDTVQRQPTSTELIDSTRAIQDQRLTLPDLEQRLIDSDEYQRIIKLQSNELAPELRRMISDKALIERLTGIYVEERKKNPPSKMIYPLRDVYIHKLDYNIFAYRAMLRHENYKYFEDDVVRAEQLTREGLMKLFDKYFPSVEDLKKKGALIAKELAAKNKSGNGSMSNVAAALSNVKCALKTEPTPKEDTCKPKPRCITDEDTNMDAIIAEIMKRAKDSFDKDKYAELLDRETRIPVKTHYGNMVLREEQSWRMPYPQTPVCTTFGQKGPTYPVMTNSRLLFGTPLDEAGNTQVGSIMPKFEYKEFITLPKQEKPKE